MRAFMALELPASLRRRLSEVIEQLRDEQAKVRWVSHEQMHLTLRFLGEISEQQRAKLEAGLQETEGLERPLRLAVGGLGAFPNKRNPRVVWVGLKPSERLIALQQRMEQLAREAGLPPEKRAFSPHLTLGRVKYIPRHSPLQKRLKEVQVESFFEDMQALTLMESQLTPGGAVYKALLRLPFAE